NDTQELELIPFAPGRAWVRTLGSSRYFGRCGVLAAGRAAQPVVTVQFGTEDKLTDKQLGNMANTIKVNSLTWAKVVMKWPGLDNAIALNGKVSLYLLRPDQPAIRAREAFPFRHTNGAVEFSLEPPNAPPIEGPVVVRLTYNDDNG